jgi:hypothetical protein
MIRHNHLLHAVFFIIVCLSNSAIAGQTTKYTGMVFAAPVKHLMPLGNGDAILITEISGIATLSDNPPSINILICSGMGVVNKESQTTLNFYCSIKASDEDSFDFKGTSTEENGNAEGTFDVIGGSGKWAGATGKGKFIRLIKSDAGNKAAFEVEITVP